MVQVVLGRRAEASDAGVPRVNVGAVAVGAVGSLAFRSAIPIVVMLVVGLVLMQAPRIALRRPDSRPRRRNQGRRPSAASLSRRGASLPLACPCPDLPWGCPDS
jgi:hypothetical protein